MYIQGLDIVRKYIPDATDVNAMDDDDRTAVMKAAQSGNVHDVQILTSLPGINLEATDILDNTALHFAALSGSAPTTRCLLDRVVDPNPKNRQGMTPFHIAAMRNSKSVVETLVQVPNIIIPATNNDDLDVLEVARQAMAFDVIPTIEKLFNRMRDTFDPQWLAETGYERGQFDSDPDLLPDGDSSGYDTEVLSNDFFENPDSLPSNQSTPKGSGGETSPITKLAAPDPSDEGSSSTSGSDLLQPIPSPERVLSPIGGYEFNRHPTLPEVPADSNEHRGSTLLDPQRILDNTNSPNFTRNGTELFDPNALWAAQPAAYNRAISTPHFDDDFQDSGDEAMGDPPESVVAITRTGTWVMEPNYGLGDRLDLRTQNAGDPIGSTEAHPPTSDTEAYPPTSDTEAYSNSDAEQQYSYFERENTPQWHTPFDDSQDPASTSSSAGDPIDTD